MGVYHLPDGSKHVMEYSDHYNSYSNWIVGRRLESLPLLLANPFEDFKHRVFAYKALTEYPQ